MNPRSGFEPESAESDRRNKKRRLMPAPETRRRMTTAEETSLCYGEVYSLWSLAALVRLGVKSYFLAVFQS